MTDRVRRVAVVMQDFSIGGIQTGIYNVANRLRGEFEFHFVASHVAFIHPRFAALGPTAHIQQPWDLVRYLRDNRIDIAQVQNVPYYTDCALVAGVPTIIERIAMDRAASNSKHGVDWVIASSEGTLPLIERTIDPGRITVIHNGVDVLRVQSASPNRLGFAPNDVIVGRVSRVGRGKNLQMLIRAMVEVNRNHPHARLVIVGDRTRREGQEDMWPELRRLARPLGSSVVFTGEINEPFEIMAGFDIATCVSSAGNEGVPNSLMESMAMGKPVVSTDVGQVSELVKHGVNGLLVPSEDTEALVGALRKLVTDPGLRSRLGEAGRQKVAAQFNVEAQASRYADLYRHLLETPSGTDGSMPHRLPVAAKKAAFSQAVRRLSSRLGGYSIARNLLPLALRHDPVRGVPYLIAKLLQRYLRRTIGVIW